MTETTSTSSNMFNVQASSNQYVDQS